MNNYQLREVIVQLANQTLKGTVLEVFTRHISVTATFALTTIGDSNRKLCLEKDDYISIIWESMEQLKRAVEKNPKIIKYIKTYSQVTFKNKILSYMKKYNNTKHKILNEFIQYDEDYLVQEYIEDKFSSIYSKETTIKNHRLSASLKYIADTNNIKPELRNIGLMLIEGKTIKQVAEIAQYSTRQIQRIKLKLITMAKNNNLD